MINFNNATKSIIENGAEFVDLRMLDVDTEAVGLEDSNVSAVQRKLDFSYGVRVFYKGAWGMVYGCNLARVKESAEKAWKIAKVRSMKVKNKFSLAEFKAIKDSVKLKVKKDVADVDIKDKLNEMFEYDSLLKEKDVKSRNISSVFSSATHQYLNSEGSEITEKRNGFNFRIMITGTKDGNLFRSYARLGMIAGYENFEKMNKEKLVEETYQKLKRSMIAKQAPAGRFPVILDNELCEVFFHEAVGHACEADAVLEKSSILGDQFGKKIAPSSLTLVDTPKVKTEFGYYQYDDEGIPAQNTVLIKKGVLNSFMQSRETASMSGAKPTGNGRAESPAAIPYPRMSTTFLKPGKYSMEELLHGIKMGVYAKGSSGGVVEPNNGNFLFNAEEAFLIENGKVTTPLRDVSLAGNILFILPRIEKIGKDARCSYFGGRCGKKGQWVPVGGKAPHIKISEAMVGGQNNK